MARLRFVSLLALPLAFSFGCRQLDDDSGGGGEHSGDDELHATDAVGDQVCADDPNAVPAVEMDIVALDIEEGSVVSTITFNGNIENWYDQQTESLPFSLQFWLFNGTYIETFFDEYDHMKVVDNRATNEGWEFSGNTLTITLSGFDVDQIEEATASTFIWDFGNYDGSCNDELSAYPSAAG